jgi:hypothetical protein
MDNGNQLAAAAASTNPKEYSRHPLNTKQQQFFQRNKQMIQQVEQAMRGALQLIVEENELKGKVTLADDFTELIIEEE